MRLPFTNPQRAHVEEDLLSAYLDKQVTPTERARVEGHLATCAQCRDELASLRQTVALVQVLPRVPVPRVFTLSEAQVGVRRQAQGPAWFGGALRGLAAVAGVALIAVVATSLLRRSAWQPTSTIALVAPTPTSAVIARGQQAPAAAPGQGLAGPTAQADASAEKPSAKSIQTTGQPTATSPAVVQKSAEKTAAPTAAPQPAPTTGRESTQPAATPAPTVTLSGRGVAAAPPSVQTSQAGATSTPGASIFGLNRSAGASAVGVLSAAASTAEPAPAAAPVATVWPSGAAMAYADGKALWVLDRDGGARTLVQAQGVTSPLISSDHGWIAYRVTGQQTNQLWAVRWDGSGARLLLSDRDLPRGDLGAAYDGRRVQDVIWVPAQRTLAVTTVASSTTGALPKIELWHVSPDSGARLFVLEMRPSDRLYYAPDGSRFAVLRGPTAAETQGGLWLYNADGSGGRLAMTYADYGQRGFDSQVSWLPDASALWLAVPGTQSAALSPALPGLPAPRQTWPGAGLPGTAVGQAQRADGLSLYRIPVWGQAELVHYLDAFEAFWSPDGNWLAYTQLAGEGKPATRALFVSRADGAAPLLYATLQDGEFNRWSPDSRQFLYQDAGQVYLGGPGRPIERLGNLASVVDPRWIAPGQILHLLTQGAGWMLVERAPDGTAASLKPLPGDVTYDVLGGQP